MYVYCTFSLKSKSKLTEQGIYSDSGLGSNSKNTTTSEICHTIAS